MLELELGDAIPEHNTVAVLTRVVVNADDPAFTAPSSSSGRVFGTRGTRARPTARVDGQARRPGLASRGAVAPATANRSAPRARVFRINVAVPVVCTGGGGIPVIEDHRGYHRGVEAVIDKDLSSAVLAISFRATTLVLATDVDAVYVDYGTPAQRPIAQATPAGLRSQMFAPGSMGPKVEAVFLFVDHTGGRGVIGSLDEIDELLNGQAGTQVLPHGPESAIYKKGTETHDRAA